MHFQAALACNKKKVTNLPHLAQHIIMHTSFTLKTYKPLWLQQITSQDKELVEDKIYS